MNEIVDLLKKLGKSISFMESCTGGALANSITNVEGASEVIKFSAVTYSNEYKIKMGVSKAVIDEFSVYSFETAREMSKNISNFSNSNFGVGITGKINRVDKENPFGKDNIVYVSIYDKDRNLYFDDKIEMICEKREDNKNLIISFIVDKLKDILTGGYYGQ